ncbi:hypothetical protein [Klebsiella pneumoniae]|uniref:hypothetical protein n=1 Tax=Klebsiella pneumoniae TaxID=573 RepID=UPI00123AFB75|nr:hypothetical protein [Klebsiella pneumoniae]QET15114.1 hypothetical protein FOB39_16315 [Klebsiella pneumoniae]
MTKSTITREQVIALTTEHSYDSALVDALEHLLSTMDSEPVAEVLSNRPGNDTSTIDRALPVGTQLYLHAQPVPVVLDEVTAEDCPAFVKYDVTEVDEAWARGFNACRAATLQASNCRENSNSSTNNFREMLETSTNSPAIPDSARDALEKALAAMEFMGDTLNNLDAVCTEDVELVAPAFDAVRSVLAAALQEGK